MTQSSLVSIYSDELKLIIPLGELNTPSENMFMPFYFEVRVAIFVTLLISLVVIQVINRCSAEIRQASYEGNDTPTLNLASLSLCGGQLHVPRGSVARFIVMMVIWCLIFKTCYQSELFKLQGDSRKPVVKSIAQIIGQNFTRHGTDYDYETVQKYTRDHGLPEYEIL